MGEFTLKEIFIILFAGGGVIGGIITALNFVTSRIDARRKRTKDGKQEIIAEAVEFRRIEAEAKGKETDVLVENLWRLVKEKDLELEDVKKEAANEIKALKKEIEDCETAEILTRPALRRINNLIRRIRNEMDSLNLIILSEEETNVFARRWGNVKLILTDLEEILDGQKIDVTDAPHR